MQNPIIKIILRQVKVECNYFLSKKEYFVSYNSDCQDKPYFR
jgi:hypothetical protein